MQGQRDLVFELRERVGEVRDVESQAAVCGQQGQRFVVDVGHYAVFGQALDERVAERLRLTGHAHQHQVAA